MSPARAATLAPRGGAAALGAYYTPERTAAFMVSLLGPGLARGGAVLEPSCGGGVFLRALRAAGVRPKRVTAFDLDPEAVAAARALGADARRADWLRESGGAARFRFAVGNPPYLNKASGYVRANRGWLRARFAGVGSGETFAMFLDAASRALEPGGRLAFLVSDTLRTLRTHARLRGSLLERFRLLAVARTPRDLFPDAAVSTVIVALERLADGAPAAARRAGRVALLHRCESEADYADAARWGGVTQGEIEDLPGRPWITLPLPSVMRLCREGRPLGELTRSHIGMHTRDNAARLAAVEGTPLAERYRRRGRGRIVPRAALDTPAWRPYLKTGGDADYVRDVEEAVDWSPEARAGYVMPERHLFDEPGVAVSGVSRRLSARLKPAGLRWDTNKVMGLVPRAPLTAELLVGILCSDLYTFLAKRFLSESSSLQITDLRRLPVPELRPRDAREIERLVRAIAARLRARGPSARGEIAAERAAVEDLVAGAARIDAADREALRADLAGAARSLPP